MPGWLVREHSLPFDRLSEDEFEIFCFFLLSKEHPTDPIYHYGKTKDSGRDIIHYKPGGKVDLIQCKRYTNTVGIGEIRGELAKLCVNQFRGILHEHIDRVMFYVTPDLSGPAQDLIANQATWKAAAPDALREFLGPKHTLEPKLLTFADNWWPTPGRAVATALTVRAAKFGDLIEEFFAMRKVIDVPTFETLIAPILQRLDAREARDKPELVSVFKSFVPPASLVPVSVCLERKGAVLLIGDPGAGKSELARELARVAQGSDPPIEILDITEADHPTRAFPRLQCRTPVVYWVDDPFGRYEASQYAAEWSRALAWISTAG